MLDAHLLCLCVARHCLHGTWPPQYQAGQAPTPSSLALGIGARVRMQDGFGSQQALAPTHQPFGHAALPPPPPQPHLLGSWPQQEQVCCLALLRALLWTLALCAALLCALCRGPAVTGPLLLDGMGCDQAPPNFS